MIIGDPYRFSITIDNVSNWNEDSTFNNGMLFFCIGGAMFPKKIINATLSHEVPVLVEKLKNIVVDERLYNLARNELLVELYNTTFPESDGLENDYRFDMTPDCFADDNYYLFAVGDGRNVRFIAAKLRYCRENSRHILAGMNLYETFISVEELYAMTVGLNEGYERLHG